MKEQPERKRADEIADRLRSRILRGEIAPHTDLPGERDLSAQLGVSRLTLRAALARLEAEGLVKPVHGSGNRVLDFRETGGIELLGHLTAVAQEVGEVPIDLLEGLLELRRVAAIEAVGLAAERATPQEIAAIRANIERQATLIDDPPAYVKADLHFAWLLAQATHNLALVFLANTIVRVLESQPGIEAAFFLDPIGSLSVYRKLAELIEARDANIARQFAKRLMTRLDARLLQEVRSFVALVQGTPAKEIPPLAEPETLESLLAASPTAASKPVMSASKDKEFNRSRVPLSVGPQLSDSNSNSTRRPRDGR